MTFLYQKGIFKRASLVVEEAHTYTPANGDTVTLDLNNGSYQKIVPNGAVTAITIANTVTGASDYAGAELTLDVEQPTSGNMTVTWGDGVIWSGGSAPTLSSGVRQVDQISMRVIARKNADSTTTNVLAGNASITKFAATSPSVFENDYSVLFDESLNQYAQAATNSEFDFDGSSPFSISMWIKPVTAVSATMRNILSKLLGAAGNWAGYNIYLLDGKLSFIFLNTYPSDQAQWTTNSTVGLSDNTWAHVVMVYTDKSTAAIYVDDSAQAATKTGTLSGSISAATKFTLGARPNDYPSSLMWDGNIDEISVWDKALSSGEVSTLFNGGTPTDLTGMTSLTNWYRMGDDASDDLTGTTGQITDVVGSNDLIPYNTTSANKVTDVP